MENGLITKVEARLSAGTRSVSFVLSSKMTQGPGRRQSPQVLPLLVLELLLSDRAGTAAARVGHRNPG